VLADVERGSIIREADIAEAAALPRPRRRADGGAFASA
jgi:hypothetical protein